MLFVFQVDTGRMMKFDMKVTVNSVQNLKSQLEAACNIPVDKQVLLISGGAHLHPEINVGAYSSGTDTSPIFLFSKAVIESDQPPAASINIGSDHDMARKVKESAELPASYTTVQKRTQLAHLFFEVGKSQLAICETLVHEQHLQQQGWSAVVANLEDLSSDLKHRWRLYQEAFNEYITKRNSYLEFLKHFKDDLLVLEKIPVLPALMESQKLLVPEQDDLSEEQQTISVKGEMSLLDWISQRDDFMDCLYDICSKGLLQTDEEMFRLLEDEVNTKLAMTDDPAMKEIKGLGDRLFGLERLMADAKHTVKEQEELANAFVRNKDRTSECKEVSILPELCATHLHHLNVLLDNHSRLRDITRRCIRAKDELSSNLYHRLKWIVFMEDNLSELDNKLVFNYENLLTLQRQLEILQQVHTAPSLYLSAVAEVVRRRSFSQSFLLWASDMACHLLTIHNEELARRKDFQTQFESHFLSSLFPGMEDFPPSFATQAPSVFDSSLPKLSQEDVEKLKRELPELAHNLSIADSSAVTNFFMIKDGKDDIDKNVDKAVEDKLMEVVTQAGLASNLDQNFLKAIENEPPQATTHGLPHLKDLDKGCESETDTEEFEKVGQSPFDLHFDKGIPSPRPGTQDASTLTEDNLQISRSEYERLRSVLLSLSQISRQTHNQLRTELNEVKNHLLREKVLAEEACGNLSININNFISARDNREREIIQRITVDHELEISDFRKIAQGKNEEIKSLRDENGTLGNQLKKMFQENLELKEKLDEMNAASNREVAELRKRIDELQIDKEKSIKEVTDRLKCEHRGELENIRARFKLITMERSPSENSLEKIERGDYTSITNHESLLLQMTENFESEKEVAVSDAVNKESQRWQKILDDRIKEMEREFQQEKAFLIEDIQRSLPEEKDKQIEKLREQINNMDLECMKYKDTIQQLTEFREESDRNELLQKIDDLEKERAALEAELEKYRSMETSTMAASVAVCEGGNTSDAATSPIKSKKRGDISTSRAAGKVNIDSCRQGDLVLVVWDMTFQNFIILQESSYMFFLNGDCMDSLGLKVVDGQPNKLYCYAEVVEKEYCHARKPVNRFRVPKGTKFFRVKVKPPPSTKEVPQVQPTSALQQTHMSQSQTTASPAMDIVMTEGPTHSLPSSPTKSATWEKEPEAAIPEEKEEDSAASDNVGRIDEDIERGTELTENFNVETETSIDRSQICVVV